MAKHHYVSRFYYKNFVYSTEDPLVYTMNKEGKIGGRRKSVSQIGYKADYNTCEQEKEQSRLETIYADVLRDFIENPDPRNSNLSRAMLDFVSFLMGNNVDTREKLDDGFSKVEFKIKDAPSDHNISMHRGYEGRYDWSEAFADAVFEEFHSWRFFPCHVNAKEIDDRFLITSDNPVSIFNPEDVRVPVPINIVWRDPKVTDISDESIPTSDGRLSRDMQVRMTLESVSFGTDVVMVFPVTPSLSLVGFSDSVRGEGFIANPERGLDAASFVNFVTYCHCNEEVYSHLDGLLIKTRNDKNNFLEFCKQRGLSPSYDIAFR